MKKQANMFLVIFFYLTTRSVPWCAAFAGHGISERVRLNRMVQAKGDNICQSRLGKLHEMNSLFRDCRALRGTYHDCGYIQRFCIC
ncbi:hypothetical protein EDD22DRAFT_890990 [Suillus occidentalis]|nr:hypothetical protein EDD22DRAFT_890990 [Suillus occidentalis]